MIAHQPSNTVGQWLFDAFSLALVGAAWCAMPMAASAATTSVAQEPLTVGVNAAPDIMLMMDDSGSMSWEFMPDWDYIGCPTGDCPGDPSDDELRDAEINGTYYNPNVIYSPPPKADGTFYPASGSSVNNYLGDAFDDGFASNPGSHTKDVTQYRAVDHIYNKYNYNDYTSFTANVQATYPPTNGCADGSFLIPPGYDHAGECAADRDSSVDDYYEAHWREIRQGFCDRDGYKLGFYGSRRNGDWYCVKFEYTYSGPFTSPDTPTCPTGGQYDAGQGLCVTSGTQEVKLFTYTSKDSSGNYVQHYVGKSQQDCGIAQADTADYPANATCAYDATTQQNVANWFSYYRSRLLMAKSGLMNAFSGMDPTFRFGFGSLHDNAGFPDGVATVTQGNYKIATVQPFDNGKTSTDQKSKFWQWIADAKANGGTPLRLGLKSIGDYYQTAQPWQTAGEDSTQLACRQAYTILTTDGFWNGDSPRVGNVDGKNGDTIANPNGTSYAYKAKPPFSDDNSSTLADVAMDYWNRDLRSTISNEVPTSSADPAFWQHMVTFTIGLGFLPLDTSNNPISLDTEQSLFDWSLNPGSGGKPASLSGWTGWPQPGSNSIYNITDMLHAAVNGHGGFYSATNPQTFAAGLRDALDRAAERAGTGASLAANSTKLATGTVAYQALYQTVTWTGDLKAFNVNETTGQIETPATWFASSLMPSWDPNVTGHRVIDTCVPSGSGPCTAMVPFTTGSTLSGAETTALGALATGASPLGSDATAANVIKYLRGDDSLTQKNSGIFRNRSTALGDIVDSQPVYVGAANANLVDGQTFTGSGDYAAYASSSKARTASLWIAANDGMLHEFNASTGVEMFAYLPAAVITGGIANLANPSYGSESNPHQYYNDGELTVADAYINGGWKTVLVGTTGRGTAKAVYALDVTTPGSPTLLWEQSASASGNNSYIGQMVGKPLVVQTQAGWAVLIGNGYDSTAGVAALLQFDLATGALTVHKTDASAANGIGMAAPTAWIGTLTNGLATVAYAGDLAGQAWSFDLTDSSSTGKLLFTAKDSGGTVQPITAGMSVGQDPATGNLWLFFGTGKYLTDGDLSDRSVQSWYGIIVQAGPSQSASLVSNLANGRAALAQRTIVAEVPPDPTATPPIVGSRAVTTGDDLGSGKSGWYIDLESPTGAGGSDVAEGERMTTPNVMQGGYLIGVTRIPISSDACNPSGRGWVMAINPFLGTNPDTPFFDLNNDTAFNDEDKISVGNKKVASAGIGFNSVPNNPIFVGNAMLTSFGNASTDGRLTNPKKTNGAGPFGRLSWRELVGQ